MKVVILAGGRGTRMAPLTTTVPKPMVEIGGMPILAHIMQRYAKFGFDEFVLALGYKGALIKRFIVEQGALRGHLSVDFRTGQVTSRDESPRHWQVDLVDTGLETQTAARLRKLSKLLDATFMLTYGDGLADVDLSSLLEFHRLRGRLATLTAVRPLARFGHVEIDGDEVSRFSEKSQLDEGWINGGFFVFEPEVLRLIPEGEDVSLESHVLPRLSKEGQLAAYRHRSFWHCMDTVRDRDVLEKLWRSGEAPWS